MKNNQSIETVEKKWSNVVKILETDFALKTTMEKWEAVDKNGENIPWYTYPAIDYLKQLDLKEKKVFEFGSGSSSFFWANNAKEVYSVESDKRWYENIIKNKKENMHVVLKNIDETYYNEILNYDFNFDIIVIDAKLRGSCAINAIKKINQDGFIIFDNSEWVNKKEDIKNALINLKNANLIQVDFCGFGAIKDTTWATSFFFTRNFTPKYKGETINPNIITGIKNI